MIAGRPRIGISSCLLGESIRYNGGHCRERFLTDTLGRFVEWVPVCPEFEVGMGVPREPVRLVGSVGEPRLVAEQSGRDWTGAMCQYAVKRVKELQGLELNGYILKRDSPSCGMERVRVLGRKGVPSRNGRGLFAIFLMRMLPLLPVEEEGRLQNPVLRENFIERVFAYQRWIELTRGRPTLRGLVDFHSRHKFLLMAHSIPHMRRLGRLVAEVKTHGFRETLRSYGKLLMEALSVRATVKKHVNVLQHIVPYFSDQLSRDERDEVKEIISDYHRGLVPLVVPLTLVLHYIKRFGVMYIQDQVYLKPHPKELMLRNHV